MARPASAAAEVPTAAPISTASPSLGTSEPAVSLLSSASRCHEAFWAAPPAAPWGRPYARVRRLDMERANNNVVQLGAEALARETAYNARMLARATEAMNDAIAVKPKTAGWYMLRAAVHRCSGRYVHAFLDANAYIWLDQFNPAGYLLRALTLRRLRRFKEALTDINTALQLDGPNGTTEYYRALILADMDEWTAAVEEAATSISHRGMTLRAHLLRARLQLTMGRLSASRSDALSALRIAPAHPRALAHLAEVDNADGRLDSAYRHLQAALSAVVEASVPAPPSSPPSTTAGWSSSRPMSPAGRSSADDGASVVSSGTGTGGDAARSAGASSAASMSPSPLFTLRSRLLLAAGCARHALEDAQLAVASLPSAAHAQGARTPANGLVVHHGTFEAYLVRACAFTATAQPLRALADLAYADAVLGALVRRAARRKRSGAGPRLPIHLPMPALPLPPVVAAPAPAGSSASGGGWEAIFMFPHDMQGTSLLPPLPAAKGSGGGRGGGAGGMRAKAVAVTAVTTSADTAAAAAVEGAVGGDDPFGPQSLLLSTKTPAPELIYAQGEPVNPHLLPALNAIQRELLLLPPIVMSVPGLDDAAADAAGASAARGSPGGKSSIGGTAGGRRRLSAIFPVLPSPAKLAGPARSSRTGLLESGAGGSSSNAMAPMPTPAVPAIEDVAAVAHERRLSHSDSTPLDAASGGRARRSSISGGAAALPATTMRAREAAERAAATWHPYLTVCNRPYQPPRDVAETLVHDDWDTFSDQEEEINATKVVPAGTITKRGGGGGGGTSAAAAGSRPGSSAGYAGGGGGPPGWQIAGALGITAMMLRDGADAGLPGTDEEPSPWWLATPSGASTLRSRERTPQVLAARLSTAPPPPGAPTASSPAAASPPLHRSASVPYTSSSLVVRLRGDRRRSFSHMSDGGGGVAGSGGSPRSDLCEWVRPDADAIVAGRTQHTSYSSACRAFAGALSLRSSSSLVLRPALGVCAVAGLLDQLVLSGARPGTVGTARSGGRRRSLSKGGADGAGGRLGTGAAAPAASGGSPASAVTDMPPTWQSLFVGYDELEARASELADSPLQPSCVAPPGSATAAPASALSTPWPPDAPSAPFFMPVTRGLAMALSQLHCAFGAAQATLRQFGRAWFHARRAILAWPGNAPAYSLAAEVAFQLGRYDDADRALSTCLELIEGTPWLRKVMCPVPTISVSEWHGGRLVTRETVVRGDKLHERFLRILAGAGQYVPPSSLAAISRRVDSPPSSPRQPHAFAASAPSSPVRTRRGSTTRSNDPHFDEPGYEQQRLSSIVWTMPEALEGNPLPMNVEAIVRLGALSLPAMVPLGAAHIDLQCRSLNPASADPPPPSSASSAPPAVESRDAVAPDGPATTYAPTSLDRAHAAHLFAALRTPEPRPATAGTFGFGFAAASAPMPPATRDGATHRSVTWGDASASPTATAPSSPQEEALADGAALVEARLLVLRGLVRERLGHADLAMSDFSAAAERHTAAAAVALLHRARCNLQCARYEAVVADIAASLPHAADTAVANDTLGQALFALGDDGGALAAFDAAITAHAESERAAGRLLATLPATAHTQRLAHLRLRRAAALACLGHLDSADSDVSAVLARPGTLAHIEEVNAWQQRAYIRYCAGRYEAALKDYVAAAGRLDSVTDAEMAPELRLGHAATISFFTAVIQANRDDIDAAVHSCRACLGTLRVLQDEDDGELAAAIADAVDEVVQPPEGSRERRHPLVHLSPALRVTGAGDATPATPGSPLAAPLSRTSSRPALTSRIDSVAPWVPIVSQESVKAMMVAASAGDAHSAPPRSPGGGFGAPSRTISRLPSNVGLVAGGEISPGAARPKLTIRTPDGPGALRSPTPASIAEALFAPSRSPAARSRYQDPVLLRGAMAAASPLSAAMLASRAREEEERLQIRTSKLIRESDGRVLTAAAHLSRLIAERNTEAAEREEWTPHLLRLRAACHHELAKLLQAQGEHLAAVRHFTIALAHMPTCTNALMRRGFSLHALRSFDAAATDFYGAVRADPGNTAYRINYLAIRDVAGLVLCAAGDEPLVPVVGVPAPEGAIATLLAGSERTPVVLDDGEGEDGDAGGERRGSTGMAVGLAGSEHAVIPAAGPAAALPLPVRVRVAAGMRAW